MSKIEDMVCEDLQNRAKVGLEKYGVTMERTDLNVIEWANHAYEEALDFAVYLKKFMQCNEPSHEDYIKMLRLMSSKLLLKKPSLDECYDLLLVIGEFHGIIDEIKAVLEEVNNPQQLDLPLGDENDNLSMHE